METPWNPSWSGSPCLNSKGFSDRWKREAWPFKSQVLRSWAEGPRRLFQSLSPHCGVPQAWEVYTEIPESIPQGGGERHPRSPLPPLGAQQWLGGRGSGPRENGPAGLSGGGGSPGPQKLPGEGAYPTRPRTQEPGAGRQPLSSGASPQAPPSSGARGSDPCNPSGCWHLKGQHKTPCSLGQDPQCPSHKPRDLGAILGALNQGLMGKAVSASDRLRSTPKP